MQSAKSRAAWGAGGEGAGQLPFHYEAGPEGKAREGKARLVRACTRVTRDTTIQLGLASFCALGRKKKPAQARPSRAKPSQGKQAGGPGSMGWAGPGAF